MVYWETGTPFFNEPRFVFLSDWICLDTSPLDDHAERFDGVTLDSWNLRWAFFILDTFDVSHPGPREDVQGVREIRNVTKVQCICVSRSFTRVCLLDGSSSQCVVHHSVPKPHSVWISIKLPTLIGYKLSSWYACQSPINKWTIAIDINLLFCPTGWCQNQFFWLGNVSGSWPKSSQSSD